MRKAVFILLALVLLLSAFAVAVDDVDPALTGADLDDDSDADEEIEVEDDDTDVGNDLVKKEKPKKKVVRNAISRLHLTAAGLAVSEDDAFDFSHAKVVVGSVKVRAMADDNVETDFAVKRMGILMLDESKYHLKNIAVADEEISADIFGSTTDSTSVSDAIGELKVKRFEKPGKDIWAGNMVLNGKTYNIYLLGMGREFKLAEVTEKIGDYCEDNPEDEKCTKINSRCSDDAEDCKEKVKEHCEENTDDQSCLQLKKLYCLKNASDERCREYLKDLCEENPRLAHCRVREVNGQRVIGVNPTAVAAVTAERGESPTSLVIDETRPGLRVARRRIEDVNTEEGEE